MPKNVRLTFLAAFLMLALIAPSLGAAASEVCRLASIAGMTERTDRIHRLLGDNVTELAKIKVFVSKAGDDIYIQSNYLSKITGEPGRYAFPTKIRVAPEKLSDIGQALDNIVFDQPPSDEASAEVRSAMASMTFLIDPSAFDAAGRPLIDLTGVRKLHMSSENAILPSGELSLATLNRPPPAVIETLEGCCLRGRPAGQGAAIRERLSYRQITQANTRLFSMVVDSGTQKVIAGSDALTPIALKHNAKTPAEWDAALTKAMTVSSGKTMIVLSHVEGGAVVVESAEGAPLFKIPLDQIHARARAQNVQLVLIGCETIKSAQDATIPVAIVGKYNTADAARRIASALTQPTDAFSFLKALSHEKLIVVAQRGGWSPDAIGAGLYQRQGPAPARWVRALRIWWMGTRHG